MCRRSVGPQMHPVFYCCLRHCCVCSHLQKVQEGVPGGGGQPRSSIPLGPSCLPLHEAKGPSAFGMLGVLQWAVRLAGCGPKKRDSLGA